MTKTIKSVKPQIRDWSSSYGAMKSVDGFFADDDEWAINCKPGNEGKVKADLEGLIGKPLDGYVIEPSMDKNTGKQREYNGHKKWTLKAQQQQGGGGFRGGGGGGGHKESYAYSKEGFEATQWSIQSQTALKCACDVSIAQKLHSPETILALAESFRGFLTGGKGPPAKAAEAGVSDAMAAMLDVSSAWKAANEVREGASMMKINLGMMKEALKLRGVQPAVLSKIGKVDDVALVGIPMLKRIAKALDVIPLSFERETHREEEA